MLSSLQKIEPPPVGGINPGKVFNRPPPVVLRREQARFAIFFDTGEFDLSQPIHGMLSAIALPAIETEPRSEFISPDMFGVRSRFRLPAPPSLQRFASPFFISLIIHTSLLLLLLYTVAASPTNIGNVITLDVSRDELDDIQPATLDAVSLSIFKIDESNFDAEPPAFPSQSATSIQSSAAALVADIAPITSNLELPSEHEGQSILKEFEHEFETEIPNSSRASRDNTHQAQFFGIQSSGNRFVFVIDSSRSMSGQRWGHACRELWKSLEALHPEQEFFLVCFDQETHLMMKQKPNELAMFRATDENITKVKRWTRSIRFGPRTFPMQALQCALSLKPDAIYVLSDGEFHDDSRRFLRNENRSMGEDRILRVHIPIHTIAFDSVAGAEILHGISVEQNGKFEFVE